MPTAGWPRSPAAYWNFVIQIVRKLSDRASSSRYPADGRCVNVVSPGPTDTAIIELVSYEVRDALTGLIPLGRLDRPQEVAAAARPSFAGSGPMHPSSTSASARIGHDEWFREVDDTYLREKGGWVYLYRAVDAGGPTIAFLLSPTRDAAAARRFFRKAVKQPHPVDPRTIAGDKNAAYPIVTKAMKREGALRRFAKLRQVKFLTNIVAQDPRRIKRLVRPGLGLKSFISASQTMAGYEAMAMIRNSQVGSVPANDMKAHSEFIAGLFSAAA